MLLLNYRAIRDDLILARNEGIKSLQIETYSRTVLNLIRRNIPQHQIQQALLEDIKTWILEFEHLWIRFSYREANKVADKLANYRKQNIYVFVSNFWLFPFFCIR